MANPIRIKRRHTGAGGPPASLASGEMAYSDVDDILYYGRGDNGSGVATSIISLARYECARPEDFGAVGDGVTDDSAAIQACADYLASVVSASGEGGQGGVMKLRQTRYLVRQPIYISQVVSIEGPNHAECRLVQDSASCGPVLFLEADHGRSAPVDSPRTKLSGFMVDGNNIGVVVTTGAVTSGSADVTVASAAGLYAGMICEANGFPITARIASIAGNVVTMDTPATATVPSRSIMFREAFTVTITKTAGSLTATVADATNIRVGHLIEGAGLKEATYVRAISGTTITLSRHAEANGTHSAIVSAYNTGIFVADAPDNGLNYRGPLIEDVVITQMGGNAIYIRPGRDNFRLSRVEGAFCKGEGIRVNSCNDSAIHDCQFGTCWRYALVVSTSATLRVSNTECWQTYLTDKFQDVRSYQNKGFSWIGGDLNGVFRADALDSEKHNILLSGINFYWSSANMDPATDSRVAYVENIGVDGLTLRDCQFDRARSSGDKPNYILYQEGTCLTRFGSDFSPLSTTTGLIAANMAGIEFVTAQSDGTAALPSVAFRGDADTGLFHPAANQIGFATGGVQRALLSATALQLDVPLTGTAVTQSATDATAGRLLKVGDSTALLTDSIAVFDSRAEAQAATVPPTQNSLRLFHQGVLLEYKREPGAISNPALTTNGGVVYWSPAGKAYAEHYGSDVSAIAAMQAAKGRVGFLAGFSVTSNVTIDGDGVSFSDGAYLDVSAGATVTIRCPIKSRRQWIFRGDGAVSLSHDPAGGGEQSRSVHVSWFGAFPSSVNNGDQAPFFQRAIDAMGNTREGRIKGDIGNYWIGSQINGNRAVIIDMAGERLGVFKVYSDGFPVFASANILFRIKHCNFELDYASLTTRTSPFVVMTHNECGVEDVRFGEALIGADLAGANCYAKDCKAYYGAYPGAGSSVVRLRGSGSWADNIRIETSTAFGPDQVVDIGGGASGNVDSPRASNIFTVGPSRLFRVTAEGGNVTNAMVNIAQSRASAGTPAPYGAEVRASGTHSVNDFSFSGLKIPGYLTNGLLIQCDSSDGIRGGGISGSSINGSSGVGIDIVRTNGVIEDISIASDVDVRDRATPISYTGTAINRVRVAPGVLSNSAATMSWQFDGMGDDTTQSITLHRNVFAGRLSVVCGLGSEMIGASYPVRLASSPIAGTAFSSHASITFTTSDLSETTAVDGQLTVCVLDKQIKVINRRGGTRNVCVALDAGTY